MKKVKAYFKMMITALICLAMSLIPGKKKGQAVKGMEEGQVLRGKKSRIVFADSDVAESRVTGNSVSSDQKINVNLQRFKDKSMSSHVASPIAGPGDRVASLYLPRADNLQNGRNRKINNPPVKDFMKLDGQKIIIFPVGLCEDDIFIREIRLCHNDVAEGHFG